MEVMAVVEREIKGEYSRMRKLIGRYECGGNVGI